MSPSITRIAITVGFAVAAVATAVVAVAQENSPRPRPCAAPEHGQFDFWIGEWVVVTPSGETAGVNRIEKILDGCALMESWTGSGGMRGHSFNIYTPATETWHQTWIDSNGMLLRLEGGLRDGVMVLAGTTPGKAGQPAIRHEISWTRLPDGRVRQHWRASRDDGKTWNDAFIGLYSRDEEADRTNRQ